MKLAAIIISFDETEMTVQCINRIAPWVDGTILINSVTSNSGEYAERIVNESSDNCHVWFDFDPDLNLPPQTNERNKRNFGLQKARELGYTHFIMMDSDEFYDFYEFNQAKKYMIDNPHLKGLVCRTKVYFKIPTLTTGYDTTLVPFIHKITPELRFTWNTNYPFAFTGPKREIRIDPTRQMNINDGVEMCDVTMHHYSYIRKDLRKKIRNSTARVNIENSSIIEDYKNAKHGYFCKFYGKTLESCENIFNIPEIIDLTI